MNKVSSTTSANIQLLRGLAIIAVVFIHNTPLGLPQVFVRPFINFSVGLFLFLSGYLSCADKWNPKKRIMKVAVPYAIWSFVYAAAARVQDPAAIPLHYVKCLLFGKAAAIMYYIFVYCEFTLLIPLIDKVARSRYKYLPFAIAPMEIVVMRLMPLVLGYSINPYIKTIVGLSCLGWFTYFYLGYVLGNRHIAVCYRQSTLGGILAVSVLLQFAEGYWYYSMGIVNCGTQVKLSAIFTGAIFMLMVHNFLKSEKGCGAKWLINLGNLSFGIYFSHIAVMCVLKLLPQYEELYFPIKVIAVVIISYACVWCGRKVLGRFARYLAL